MKTESDHAASWRDLFENRHATLVEAAHLLLCQHQDPEVILRIAFNRLKNRTFHEFFGRVSAVREVIKVALERNDEFSEEEFRQPADLTPEWWPAGPLPLDALPWAERAVYYLREILHYARRDTALLLGVSDGEVDGLLTSARQRIGHTSLPKGHLHPSPAPPAASIRIQHSIAFAAIE